MRVVVIEFVTARGPLPASVAGDDAAALGAAGMAMRDALMADLQALRGVEATAPTCPAHQPFTEFVRDQAAQHDAAWIIAPESGGWLARLHDAVGASRWIGCGARAIAVASSKHATREWLHRHGIPTTLDIAAGADQCWVVKPDDGAGCTHTRLHATLAAALADERSRTAAPANERRGSSPTLREPHVDGEALSITVWAEGDDVRTLACNRQHVRAAPGGLLVDHGVDTAALDREADPRRPALHAIGSLVARALPGLQGVFGIDLVWHPQRGPVVIEVNPRLTCAYAGLSAALGRNVAGLVLSKRLQTLAVNKRGTIDAIN
jgi:tyramine---L-glutamate ligase